MTGIIFVADFLEHWDAIVGHTFWSFLQCRKSKPMIDMWYPQYKVVPGLQLVIKYGRSDYYGIVVLSAG